jgi:hypothetical protein
MVGAVPQLLASLPGLTRQSIAFHKIRFVRMDARVKPAHDGVRS